jgi:hypothetical protein
VICVIVMFEPVCWCVYKVIVGFFLITLFMKENDVIVLKGMVSFGRNNYVENFGLLILFLWKNFLLVCVVQ